MNTMLWGSLFLELWAGQFTNMKPSKRDLNNQDKFLNKKTCLSPACRQTGQTGQTGITKYQLINLNLRPCNLNFLSL